MVTKAGKGSAQQHQYRFRIDLREVRVSVFSTGDYPWGIQLQQRSRKNDGGKVLATFDARTQNDQQRFVADLQESVAETQEMEKAKMFLNDIQNIRKGVETFQQIPMLEESLTFGPESFC